MNPDAPRLYRIILPVADIERAAEFYSKLLGMPGERISPGRHYFKCGPTILAVYDPGADGDRVDPAVHPHANQYLYFAVADLEAVHGRAKDLPFNHLDGSIAQMPWGERLFYARDPFGNGLCFVDDETLFTGC